MYMAVESKSKNAAVLLKAHGAQEPAKGKVP